METSELTGAALDWAVAKCEGHTGLWIEDDLHGNHISRPYTPSTDWSQGGPIIEREKIQMGYIKAYAQWAAYVRISQRQVGPAPLIAAMRCYVESELGDNVEVPEELL